MGPSPSPERDGQVRIKKRIAKPKKLRRQDPGAELEDVDTPGAGPSRTSSASTPSTPARAESPPPVAPTVDAAHFHATARSLSIKGLSKHPMRRSALAPRRSAHPALLPCRSVYEYTRLNHIEEGTYGIVFRARCNETGEIYALKKLKLEEEKQGFPITSLREVMALMTTGAHENVVGVREIVVGDTLNQIFIVMPFIEHDLKTLLEDMPHPFVQSEVKTLMLQLLSAVAHCHSNWIVRLQHRFDTGSLLRTDRDPEPISEPASP